MQWDWKRRCRENAQRHKKLDPGKSCRKDDGPKCGEEITQTMTTSSKTKKRAVLRSRSADSAENWTIQLRIGYQGLNGDMPQAKTVLRIARNGPERPKRTLLTIQRCCRFWSHCKASLGQLALRTSKMFRARKMLQNGGVISTFGNTRADFDPNFCWMRLACER